jgi:uncharacterized protein YbjT (DUF2867 family)
MQAAPQLPTGDWNGKLAVVGVDGAAGRTLQAECAALLTRGYACIPMPGNVGDAHAAVLAAREALASRYGRALKQVAVFALARSAYVALRLAHEWPTDIDGMVLGTIQFKSAYDPDLSAFGRRGGRLMMLHGEDDRTTPTKRAVQFFESYERLLGKPVPASAFLRLFIYEGMDHSLRGPGAGRTDYCLHLERWLDSKPARPPDQPLTQRRRAADDATSLFAPTALDASDIEFTRPAYPYPLRAMYKGYGDINRWQSWYALARYQRKLGPVTPDELPLFVPQDPARRDALVVDASASPVALLGATGRLGLELVRALRAQGVTVRAIVRDETKARAALPGDVEITVADVRDADALRRAVRGAKTLLFSAAATSGGVGNNTPEAVDYTGVVNAAAAAKAEGLAHVVLVSSLCATQTEHVHNLYNNLLVWKFRGEEALRKSGVPYTVLRPGGLRPGAGMPPFEPGTRGIRFAQGDRIAFGVEIHRADVAQVLMATLGNAQAMGKTFEVFNDDSVPKGAWVGTFGAITRD